MKWSTTFDILIFVNFDVLIIFLSTFDVVMVNNLFNVLFGFWLKNRTEHQNLETFTSLNSERVNWLIKGSRWKMAAQKTAQFVLRLVKMIEIVVQKIVTVWKPDSKILLRCNLSLLNFNILFYSRIGRKKL